jgi:putative sigma-54 modulation protein
MEIHFQVLHTDAGEETRTFITEKCRKLDQYFNRIQDISVILKSENDKTGSKLVEMTLNVPTNTLFASETGSSFEEAADLCIGKLKAQLVKHKEKMRG